MIKKIEVKDSLQGEEWVKIYDRKISSFGRFIKINPHGKEIGISEGGNRQRIKVNGEYKRLYRLVCEIWHPKTKEDIELGRDYVDHIDGNPNNDRADNLRWCTCKENMNFPPANLHLKQAKIGYKPSEETKLKMKEKWEDPSYREKMSRIRKEFRTRPEIIENSRHKQTKKVLCKETGEIFYSAHEASRKTGINRSNICTCCRHKGYKTAGGYHWEYV